MVGRTCFRCVAACPWNGQAAFWRGCTSEQLPCREGRGSFSPAQSSTGAHEPARRQLVCAGDAGGVLLQVVTRTLLSPFCAEAACDRKQVQLRVQELLSPTCSSTP